MASEIYESLERRALEINENLPELESKNIDEHGRIAETMVDLRRDYIRNYQDLSNSEQIRLDRLVCNIQQVLRDSLDVVRVRDMRRSMERIAKDPNQKK